VKEVSEAPPNEEDELYGKIMAFGTDAPPEPVEPVKPKDEDEEVLKLFPDDQFVPPPSEPAPPSPPPVEEKEEPSRGISEPPPKLTRKEERELRRQERYQRDREQRQKGIGQKLILLTAEIDEFFSEFWVEEFAKICNLFHVPITFFITVQNEDKWNYHTSFIKRRFDNPDDAEFGTHGYVHQKYSELKAESADEQYTTLNTHLAWQSRLSHYHRAPYFEIDPWVDTLLKSLKFKADCSGIKKKAEITKKDGLVRFFLTEIRGSTRKDLVYDIVKHIKTDKFVALSFRADREGCIILKELLTILNGNGLIPYVLPLRTFVEAA